MRKTVFLFLSMILVALAMVSCKNSSGLKCNTINCQFKADLEIKSGDHSYSCEISRSSPSTIYLRFTAPESLRDISYQIKNGSLMISCNNLQYIRDDKILPDGSFVILLFSVFDMVSSYSENLEYNKTENILSEYSGIVNGENFSLSVDDNTGFISTIDIKSKDLHFEFHNLSNI